MKRENTPNKSIDLMENASDELVMVFSVCPAWMARNDGGATPTTENKIQMNCHQLKTGKCFKQTSLNRLLTEKCAHKEWKQRNTDDWGHQIDEPVGQERCHTEEEHVAEQFVLMILNLYSPFGRTIGAVVFHQASADQLWQQIAQCGTNGWTCAHHQQCHPKWEQKSR